MASYGVFLKIPDGEDAERIRHLWRILSFPHAGGAPLSTRQFDDKGEPHVGLVVFNDLCGPSLAAIVQGLSDASKTIQPLPVKFDGIVTLPRNAANGEVIVHVHARPDITEAFTVAHAAICQAIPSGLIDDKRTYDRAVRPFMTVGCDIPISRAGDALKEVLNIWRPFNTMFKDLVLFEYVPGRTPRPFDNIKTFQLGG